MDRLRRGGRVACYIANYCLIIKSQVFVLIFKYFHFEMKANFLYVLYQSFDKLKLIEYFDNYLKQSNISSIQERYLMCDLVV